MDLSIQQYQMFLFAAVLIIVVVGFRLRSFIFAWLKVIKSFGSLFLIRVKNPTQNYYVAGRVDKGFLYFKGRKRPDNTSPNRMISTTHTWNRDTGKLDKSFSFSAAVSHEFGVRVVEVDDLKDCIIFYQDAAYDFVHGTNTELHDELMNTALNKPSRLDGLVDVKKFQMYVLIGLGLLIIIGVFVAWQARLLPNVFAGLIETNGLVKEIHNLVIVNATG